MAKNSGTTTYTTVTATEAAPGMSLKYGVKWTKVETAVTTANGVKITFMNGDRRIFKPGHVFDRMVITF